MPDDAERCREHAKECWAWAASTNNPSVKESLTDLAKRWTRLATAIEASRILFEEVGRVSNATRETDPTSIKSRQAVEKWHGKLSRSGSAKNDGRP
jgi:Zn-dependent oligopeptidase